LRRQALGLQHALSPALKVQVLAQRGLKQRFQCSTLRRRDGRAEQETKQHDDRPTAGRG
jgi:hypothetical protein